MNVAVILSLLASVVGGFHPFEGPTPVLVFIQTDPWAMVIGSDTPRIAIYDTGEAIFTKKVGGGVTYHRVILDKAALTTVREHLQPVLALKNLQPSYNVAPHLTDQPVALLYLRDGQRESVTSVYGLAVPGTKLKAYTSLPGGPAARIPPEEILKLHEWLSALDFPKSETWTPRYVEVMLWDYSYAPDASIQWPKDWPSLDSERAMQRGDSYSIFLDGALLPKLRDFLATRKPKGAVELGGRKWAVSYRYTFPSEPEWMKAFLAADE